MTIWTDFCRTFERAGELIDRPETPIDEIDRAEGLSLPDTPTQGGARPRGRVRRSAATRTRAGAGQALRRRREQRRLRLSARHGRRPFLRYRLHGQRGGAPFMEIGLYAGRIGFDPTSRLVDALREDRARRRRRRLASTSPSVHRACGGHPARRTRRQLSLHPAVRARLGETEPASLALELVDDASGAAGGAARPRRRSIGNCKAPHGSCTTPARRGRDSSTPRGQGPPNVLHPVAEPDDLTLPSGHRFAFGHFDLGDDEALLIEFHPRRCRTGDWRSTTTGSRCSTTAHTDRTSTTTPCARSPTGKVRVAISSRPGHRWRTGSIPVAIGSVRSCSAGRGPICRFRNWRRRSCPTAIRARD